MNPEILECIILNASNEMSLSMEEMKINNAKEDEITENKNNFVYNRSELSLPGDSKIFTNRPSKKSIRNSFKPLQQILEYDENLERDVRTKESCLDDNFKSDSNFNFKFTNSEREESQMMKGYQLTRTKQVVTYQLQVYLRVTPETKAEYLENVYDPNFQKTGTTVVQLKVARRFKDFWLLYQKLSKISAFLHFACPGDKSRFADFFSREKEAFYIKRKISLQIFLNQIIARHSLLKNYDFYMDFFDHVRGRPSK